MAKVHLFAWVSLLSLASLEAQYRNIRIKDDYLFDYQTKDASRTEQGTPDDNGDMVVMGSYSFLGTDGRSYIVDYIADKNGYRPKVRSGIGQSPKVDGDEVILIGSATLATLNG